MLKTENDDLDMESFMASLVEDAAKFAPGKREHFIHVIRAPGWDSDWTSSEDRDSALNAAFEYCGMDAKVISMEKRNVMHGRRMTIRLSNKREIVVWLDQGWSYWSLSREMRSFSHISFDGNLSPESTGKALAEFGVNVQGHDLPTYVFIE